LFEVHDAGLVAHRFDEGTQAEIAGAAQEALAGADDESQRFLGEGIVAQAGAVELVEDELLGGLGAQTGEQRRIECSFVPAALWL
jgi:hypothetical protein